MGEWRELFRQRMWEAKPGDAWSLRKTEEHLEARNLEPGWMEALQKNARGSFRCSQCYRTWSSYQVVILFHIHWETALRQGQVMMRLFRQQCQRCSPTLKEKPQFTREAMESVIQHLILDIREKCYRERVHRSELLEVVCEGRGPHKSESCEACQLGLHKGHRGKPDGALHHGKPDGALHHGKPDGALHHGNLGSGLYCGSSKIPRYSCTPKLPSNEISPVRTSGRRSQIQPPNPSAAPTSSRRCCICCVCCIVISAVCVIFVLVAYWRGWF